MRTISFSVAFMLALAGCDQAFDTDTSDELDPRETLIGVWDCEGTTSNDHDIESSISFLSNGTYSSVAKQSYDDDEGRTIDVEYVVGGNWNVTSSSYLERTTTSFSLKSMEIDYEEVSAFNRTILEGRYRDAWVSQPTSRKIEYLEEDSFDLTGGGADIWCSR